VSRKYSFEFFGFHDDATVFKPECQIARERDEPLREGYRPR
jgi:hypothetical protein